MASHFNGYGEDRDRETNRITERTRQSGGLALLDCLSIL